MKGEEGKTVVLFSYGGAGRKHGGARSIYVLFDTTARAWVT